MIPVCEPCLIGNEKKYVLDCIETNSIASGKYICLFEEAFASYCGTKHCICCSSGTAALHLCLAALRISRGDHVILPSFTMIATCNAVTYSGATPVLVDSEMETWNMDTACVQRVLSPNVRAIIAVHTYGHTVDMKPLFEISEKHGVPIIEDAAEAHGAEYMGQRAGGLGALAAFSFYANKIITTGEGGAVTTSDPELADRLRKLRNHFFDHPRFVHTEIGYNYRMSNIQAAIGLAQLEKADLLLELRRRNASCYNSLLKDVRGIRTPPEAKWAKNTYWMYGILLDEEFPVTRDTLIADLKGMDIDSRPFFHPMHLQPAYKAGSAVQPILAGSMKNAEALGARGLYLPSGGSLKEDQIKYISSAVRQLSQKYYEFE
jgi:perosamine synthetase